MSEFKLTYLCVIIKIYFVFYFFRLSGVSIEFTKKHDMEESINELKNKNVDPFNGKFIFKISLNLKNFEYKILKLKIQTCFFNLKIFQKLSNSIYFIVF